ncbi:MAG: hypothetical protein JNJ90_12900 [Saprospiraceae bacterium]|jgi:hypothetical protein|nr:hypothetical protein [Saprospiraceae bacterium]
MAVITFEKIAVQDLDQRLVDSIKAFFKNGNVRISITIENEDRKALMSLHEIVQKNRQAPYVVRFDEDFDFDGLADALEADESLDVLPVLEKHKISNPNVAPRTSRKSH